MERRIKSIELVLTSEDIKPTQQQKIQPNLENQIASGLMKGIQQLRESDENHMRLVKLARESQRTSSPIFNQNVGDETINTHGDLIPTNLTKEEKEVLRIFYEQK